MIYHDGAIASTFRQIQPVPGAVLDVVCAVSNPRRWNSRHTLYRAFEKHVIDSGARLTTVEVAFGDRAHEISDELPGVRYVKLRTRSELWLKENAINLGVARLDPDWRYVAWVDADVHLVRPDWVYETLHQLQHHPIVQLFSHAIDLGPDHGPLPSFYGPTLKPASWGYCNVHGFPTANVDLARQLAAGRMDVDAPSREPAKPRFPDDVYYCQEQEAPPALAPHYYWHPGFAWACTRDCWNATGGLIDFSILGAADYLMAAALTGHLSLSDWLAAPYREWVQEWEQRAVNFVRGDVGYVSGLLTHAWHGSKQRRGYRDRWRVFRDHTFNPATDIHRDWQGLWQLGSAKPGLRDDLRAYFRARNEDSIEA